MYVDVIVQVKSTSLIFWKTDRESWIWI